MTKSLEFPLNHFENLSNEIFYEIFDFLDTCDAYEAFYHLNNRFRQIFVELFLPYRININLISKKNVQQLYQYIITPNKHRIISLRLSNWICVDHFPFHLSFIRLQSIIINEVKSEKVQSLLMNFSLIPQLFSLSITTIGIIKDPNTIHRLIFALPVLKYCNTTFQWRDEKFSLSNSINENSSIEHFISKSKYNLKKLNIILSYMPQLVRLSCIGYLSSENRNIWRTITLNNLTQFYLDHSISFVEFEMFMSNMFHKLEVLRITSRYNNDYLDSNRWEQLIINHLPCLHTFDLQHIEKISNLNNEYSLLIDGFISPFWIQRKWFFNHQYYRYNRILWAFFYSVKQTYSSEQINLDFFRHIVIENDKTTIDLCSSQLTLSNKNDSTDNLYINELNHIISFKQLNKLIVTPNNFDINQLMELLYLSPNIHVLILSTYSSCYYSLQNKINNNIQQIIIYNKHLTLKEVQELIDIFPRLKSLDMKIKEYDLELIIRFILKHNINKNSSLQLLILQNAHCAMINRLQKVIDREELIHNYFIEFIEGTAYLWL